MEKGPGRTLVQQVLSSENGQFLSPNSKPSQVRSSEKGQGGTLVRSSEKGLGRNPGLAGLEFGPFISQNPRTLQVRSSEKGQGRTLVWQVRSWEKGQFSYSYTKPNSNRNPNTLTLTVTP